MSDFKAFALKESVSENFSGGSVGYGPLRQTFDIKQALEEGNGVIVVDMEAENGSQLFDALNEFPDLKHATLPSEYKGPDAPQVVVTEEAQKLTGSITPASKLDSGKSDPPVPLPAEGTEADSGQKSGGGNR